MKLIIQSIFLVLVLAYMAEIKISLSPFSISFGRGWLVLGYILIAIGGSIIYYQGRWDGLKCGAEIKKEVIEEIKQQQEIIKESI